MARRSGILHARRLANAIGHRTPQHDSNHLYASSAKPFSFHPDWKLPAPIPRPPWPEDPTESLLWIVSPAAAAAQPWLPTIAEQDAAWWAQFGEVIENRQRLHRDGLAIGARG
jgi:hypothetical protein